MRLLPAGTPLPSRLCAFCLASLRSALCPRSIRLPNDRACNYSKTKDSITITGAQGVAGISQLQSIFFYRGVVPDLLIRWKYDGMVELTNLIASWAANHCQISDSYDLATIVPCHWRRRLTRGFDHMWLLANALAKRGLIESPTKTLKHSKLLPFLHLQAASDRHNDPDHFCAVCSLKGKLIIIIDDVITPGAILRAAAAALKNGGAEIAQRRGTRYCRRRERGYKALISHRQNELSAKRLLSRASKYACVSTGSRNISSRV